MFLSKIGVPQTCFEIALTWSTGRSNFENKKDPCGTTYKIGLTISSRKNGCPCKRNYNDRSSTQGGVLGMTSCYRVIKDQCYNSWKNVPTIISD